MTPEPASKAPSSPVETTEGEKGTSERLWDLDAPYATWDLLDLIAYIDHWRAKHAALTVEVERLKDPVAAREDTAERLWRELEEATNVPDYQCSLNDPECDGTYCANAIQAADDRRAL